MWELLILFGIVAIILYFVVYSYYSQNIKGEKDFARDVFYYLVRRYPETQVTNWGGLSSDPIVESRNSGPFRTLEVRVTTENRNGVVDRDLILRGMVDVKKYQIARNDVSNVLISPKISWNDPKAKVILGLQALDKRLNVNAYNPVFVRDLIVRTDLGNLIEKNYDFEAFSLHYYKTGDLAIQIRMESMNSSSFLSAFNMALAAVGILIQKGYLTRLSKQQETIITKGKSPKIEEESVIRKIPTYKASELPKINVDTARHQETFERKQKLKSYSDEQINGEIEMPGIISPNKDVTEVNLFKPLFTSIRYQVKYINYGTDKVIIGTFSTQVPQIVVTFPNSDEAKIVGKSIQKSKKSFNIRINNAQVSQTPTWDKPWKNIELTGTASIIEQINFRTAIANRINEIGSIDIDITGSDDGISYSILIRKSKTSITAGYSLFIDLVWFFEML
jgi:hypothetical protein